MRRTRRDPPTLDELRIDAARQMRLMDNVERLRLAYVEEKERLRIGNEELLRIGGGAEAAPNEAGFEPAVQSGEEGTERTLPTVAANETATTELGDSVVAAKAAKQRETEREATKQRRDDFGESNHLLAPLRRRRLSG